MKKTTRRPPMNSDLAQKHRLGLVRETVRTLDADHLARVAGGSGCDTTSLTSDGVTSKK